MNMGGERQRLCMRGANCGDNYCGGGDSDGNDCRRRVAAAMNKGTKLRRLWQHRWRRQLALPRRRRGWWWRQLAHPLFHSTAEACCEWFFIGTGQANGWGWSRGGWTVVRTLYPGGTEMADNGNGAEDDATRRRRRGKWVLREVSLLSPWN